jgi:sigma-B regulation protein RsbU (phosphoserine phosphatase)
MDKPSIRILLVEDNPYDAELLQETLSDVPTVQFEWVHVPRLNDAITRLREERFDIILLDLSLPDSQGQETLARAYGQAHDTPIVILTGHSDESMAVKTVHQGAQDYLVKGQVDAHTLVRSIRYAIERHRLITELDRGRQQQLKIKDQFLSHVSHELRSPLAVIHQFVTILLDRLAGDLTPEQTEYLGIILRNVNQLRKMIEELLEVTRAETGKLAIHPQWTPLPELIHETLEPMQIAASGKGINLSAEISSDLPFAYADPNRVRQILMNLIDNAIKFTPEKGRIVVRARASSEDPHFLCISVADTGCGIPPEETKKIFDSMYQVKDSIEINRKGLGLGLYICKGLVSRHGGRIWVESEFKHGSTFYFTLPIFSWANQMAPILIPKNMEIGSIALFTVEIFFKSKRFLTKSDEAILREVWNILKQCILIDKDVLLPRMASTKWGEMFFIIAFADQRGAEVLTHRIHEQIGRYDELQKIDLDTAVSCKMFEISSKKEDHPWDDLVKDITRNIGDQIESASQEEDPK